MARLAISLSLLRPSVTYSITRCLCVSSRLRTRGPYSYDARRGRDPDDGDYDVHYEDWPGHDYNKPVPGSYTEGYSGDPKEAARLDGQKNFEGFPLANLVGQYDYQHTPKHLREKEFAGPLCEDRFGQRYPGYWIKGRFHYVKEMEPEIIVPDLTDFPLKPYVSYRASEIEQPELTAKALFNLVYADDVYKRFLSGQLKEGEEEGESLEQMIASGDQARAEAEKTGSDRFVPDSWYGIDADKFD